jgi:hypothetical protein
MSAVISFPASRVRQTRQPEGAGEAEVIIFPGVRVERLGFDLAERLPAGRRSSAQAQPRDLELY